MSASSENTPRQLLIMRHGKADWEVKVDDLQRPMTERGIEEAANVGRYLQQQSYRPDIIISSNASRAIATSKLIAEAMAISDIAQDARIYNASVETLFTVLADIDSKYKTVMIVGHNPGVETLLLHLAKVGESFYKKGALFTTGTIAIVNMPDDWQQLNKHCGQLVSVIRGGDL